MIAAGASLCAIDCSATGATCPTGLVCAHYTQTLSACVPDCRITPGQCTTGTACNQTVGFCTAMGSLQFGDACGGTLGACGSGLICITISTNPAHGYCTADCTSTACPTSPGGATCFLSDGKTPPTNYCGFMCTGASADAGVNGCPAELKCVPISTVFACE
jgi:hypothetical protein